MLTNQYTEKECRVMMPFLPLSGDRSLYERWKAGIYVVYDMQKLSCHPHGYKSVML